MYRLGHPKINYFNCRKKIFWLYVSKNILFGQQNYCSLLVVTCRGYGVVGFSNQVDMDAAVTGMRSKGIKGRRISVRPDRFVWAALLEHSFTRMLTSTKEPGSRMVWAPYTTKAVRDGWCVIFILLDPFNYCVGATRVLVSHWVSCADDSKRDLCWRLD